MEELTKLKNLLKFGEDKNYYADKEYITNSMLGMLNKSPQHLQRYFDGHREESPALNFGSAFHTMILEPHRMDDEVVVFEGKTRRGKAWDKFSME
ncbi:MAG: PD-(D/E)XK nuclease-like domain-containing protein, partial [Pelagibacterales bacterium]|nr:PD-(D/E)XK nuclease-like domain-containing protein [Pelagibacterales bacterium]